MPFDFNPGGVYNPRPLDFSELANLPEEFWKGQAVGRQNALRNELSALPRMPDGSPDLKAAASAMMKYDPIRGAQLLQSFNNQEALNEYRRAMVENKQETSKPPEQRLWEWWKTQNGAEPMRASEPQPSGTPGVSLQNAPGFIQKKLMSIEDQQKEAAEGKLKGQNAGMQSAREALAPRVQSAIQGMSDYARSLDNPSFTNALGPLQGADPGADSSIITGGLARAARLGGEIMNKWEGGKTVPTEVRAKIMGDTNALALAIKPMVRNPGEGIWSDRDQNLLNYLVGNLSEARTPEEYQRRLDAVVERMNNTFGLHMEKPSAPSSKTEEKIPAYDAAEPAPPAAAAAGGSPSGPFKDGQTAVNPQTGQRLLFQNGAWVPIR